MDSVAFKPHLERARIQGLQRIRVVSVQSHRCPHESRSIWEFSIPRLLTSYEVFADGKLGRPVRRNSAAWPVCHRLRPDFPIPTDSSSAGHPIVIAIRVWNMDWLARFGGGPEGAPTIGEMDALKALKTQNDWERFWSITAGNALMLMNLVAAFAGFFLFWMRPADREYLWFGLYELLTGVQHLCTDWVMFYPTDWKTDWLLDDFLATASWLFFLVFVFRILNGRRNWLFWAAVGTEVATMVGTAASLAEWISWDQWRIGALVCPDSIFCLHFVPSLPESASRCRGCPIDVCASCRLLLLDGLPLSYWAS